MAGSTEGYGAGRLRSRREAGRSKSATFCLRTKPRAGPAPKEYQGSHKRDMAAYHTPWKGNQWSGSPNLDRWHPGSTALARDSRKECDSRSVSEEDPPLFASILLAPETQAMPTLIRRTGVGCEKENYQRDFHDPFFFLCETMYPQHPNL